MLLVPVFRAGSPELLNIILGWPFANRIPEKSLSLPKMSLSRMGII